MMKLENRTEKIKNFLKKRNYWQKGTVIGFLVGVLLFIAIKVLEYFSFNLEYNFFFLYLIGFANAFSISVVYPMICYGFIVGLILFFINKKYPLNKLSMGKFSALVGFIIIFLLVMVITVISWPPRLDLFTFFILLRLAIIITVTLYFYVLGWVYDEIKKKTWWKLVIYFIIFLVLFIIMWRYISFALFISQGITT